MKQSLLFPMLSALILLPVTSIRAESLGPEAAKTCKAEPLTFACLDHYAQRNQENVARILGDITAGRLPAIPPPALPLLEELPTIDLGKLPAKL
jgi:hypothetical protein